MRIQPAVEIDLKSIDTLGRSIVKAIDEIELLRGLREELLASLKAILNDPDNQDVFNEAVASVRKAERMETAVRS